MSALGLAAAMAPRGAVGQAAPLAGAGNQTPDVGAEISNWVTAGEKRLAAARKTPPPKLVNATTMIANLRRTTDIITA